MFTFSFEWLQSLSQIPLEFESSINILNLQGLEVQKIVENEKDKIVTIEVKANRPDALSHMGVLRELYAFNHINPLQCHIPEASIGKKSKPSAVQFKLDVRDGKRCRRFCLNRIDELDNSSETPANIRRRLESCGINIINPIVDILNYIMLETGQPLHAYDLDKLEGNLLIVKENTENFKFLTLAHNEVEIPTGSIVIYDEKDPLIVAGIIGGKKAEVDRKTKNILLEAAHFDGVSIRVTSRKIKISTPSSFRFERGVDITQTKLILDYVTKTVIDVCGGNINDEQQDYYPDPQKELKIKLDCKKTDKLLGIKLKAKEMQKCLNKYACQTTLLDEDHLWVTPPHFRLDLLEEIDLVEEVARAYGYHHIKPTFPHAESGFTTNPLWDNCDKLRNLFVSLGFYEVINYSFIPRVAMKQLGLPNDHPLFSDVELMNPITEDHALMRPTLVYSLMQCMAYNYSNGNKDLGLFEIGRIYRRKATMDTGYIEKETCGLLFTGVRIESGFGIDKSIHYSFYDLMNFIEILKQHFAIEIRMTPYPCPFLESGSSHQLEFDGHILGYLGQIRKDIWRNIPNGKLIKTDALYLEMDITMLKSNKKVLKRISAFPGIVREYNFIADKSVSVSKISNQIKNQSPLVSNIQLRDIYEGKGIPVQKKSILLEVNYSTLERTLTAEEVEVIEKNFLERLSKEDIKLRA